MSSTDPSALQSNYDANATAYNQFLRTPLGTLESQLFALAIPPCSAFNILDLGGGTGLRARDALLLGAAHVDFVDISPEMMRLGQDFERNIGREGAIEWFQADVSENLGRQLGEEEWGKEREGRYDLVIANGVFDHATTRGQLEGMWANAARYLKSGGRVVANRNNPFSEAVGTEGKYGVRFEGFERLADDEGWKYTYRVVATQPELVFESYALNCYVNGEAEVAGRWFQEFQNVRWEETDVVKENKGLWKDYIADPILFIFTARKRKGAS